MCAEQKEGGGKSIEVPLPVKAGPVLSLSTAVPFTEDGARMLLLAMSPSDSPVETLAFGTFH